MTLWDSGVEPIIDADIINGKASKKGIKKLMEAFKDMADEAITYLSRTPSPIWIPFASRVREMGVDRQLCRQELLDSCDEAIQFRLQSCQQHSNLKEVSS